MLNPHLDMASLASDYAVRQRLQVRDFLEVGAAEALRTTLERKTPWGLAFNNGDQIVYITPEQRARMGMTDQQKIASIVSEGAKNGYQFLYSIYPLLQNYFNDTGRVQELFDLFEWLNGDAFLNFARRLTGLQDIVWADAQATMYSAGQFLKYHTDETPSQKRLAAYVINLTPDWGRDWGGYLQFFDGKFDIEEGLRPLFNAINIFTIPADHSVSIVAPYVTRPRLSITGWLRGDAPPRPIGRS